MNLAGLFMSHNALLSDTSLMISGVLAAVLAGLRGLDLSHNKQAGRVMGRGVCPVFFGAGSVAPSTNMVSSSE